MRGKSWKTVKILQEKTMQNSVLKSLGVQEWFLVIEVRSAVAKVGTSSLVIEASMVAGLKRRIVGFRRI
jgi:hypothetical protein